MQYNEQDTARTPPAVKQTRNCTRYSVQYVQSQGFSGDSLQEIQFLTSATTGAPTAMLTQPRGPGCLCIAWLHDYHWKACRAIITHILQK